VEGSGLFLLDSHRDSFNMLGWKSCYGILLDHSLPSPARIGSVVYQSFVSPDE
jgi:hypothetical protein